MSPWACFQTNTVTRILRATTLTRVTTIATGQRVMSEIPTPGAVMVIGGAEDKLNEKVILTRFVKLAGGPDGHVVVISTASSMGDAATELYRGLFTRLGMGRVSGLRP